MILLQSNHIHLFEYKFLKPESEPRMFSFLKPSAHRCKPIAPADAVARAARGDLVLIDVRDISELKSSGKARGAVHVPLMALQSRMAPGAADLPKGVALDTPICLYCASGGRSGMAADTLLGMGYTEVYNLGGLGHWQAGGGAIERV
ncbi:hypothetical protein GCM10007291_12750 [Gemmobacter nanjingensis]|nr:hypothetical protein GCM10007291_12750 [Gemmobacter nanjingensis]